MNCSAHPFRVASRPAFRFSNGGGHFLRVAFPFLVAVALPFSSAARAQTSPFLQFEFLAYSGRGDLAFDGPLGVAVHPQGGEYAVANTGRGRIEILDAQGHSLAYFAHDVHLPGGRVAPGQPAKLCYTANGDLLVVDNADRDIDVLAHNGRSIGRIHLPATAPPAGGAAYDTTAGPLTRLHDGTLLVASRGNPAHVWHLDADGRVLDSWGTPGERPGQLNLVTGLAEAPSGEIVITCGMTELGIQRFDATGKFLGGFGRHEIGPGNVSLPSGIAITPDGRMWVADELRQCVQVFDRAGNYIGLAGDGGPEIGSFLFPSDVKNDGGGTLLVLDRVGARVQAFRILDLSKVFDAPERR